MLIREHVDVRETYIEAFIHICMYINRIEILNIM